MRTSVGTKCALPPTASPTDAPTAPTIAPTRMPTGVEGAIVLSGFTTATFTPDKEAAFRQAVVQMLNTNAAMVVSVNQILLQIANEI